MLSSFSSLSVSSIVAICSIWFRQYNPLLLLYNFPEYIPARPLAQTALFGLITLQLIWHFIGQLKLASNRTQAFSVNTSLMYQ